jgi:protein-disulfide isomerase
MTKSTSSGVRTTRTRRKAGNNNIGLWIVGIAAAVVLVVVVVVALNSRPGVAVVEAPDVPAEWVIGTTLGNPDAKVTIQAWEDFLCPACRQFSTAVKSRLIEEYIKPGTVRLEFHQFPLSGHAPGSNMGAMASLCAADQEMFWPYHDRLFLAQDQGQEGFTIDNLVRYADDMGMDSRAFLDCMSSQQYREQVAASANEAVAMGLNATPSVLVNGIKMTNPFDFDEMRRLIDDALATAGN